MTTVLPVQTASSATSPTPPPRFVPASVGRPGRVQTVQILDPHFCVLDHVTERMVAVEDISHRGTPDCVQVPTMGDDLYSAFEVYAQLYADPTADDPRLRVAAVTVTDGSREAYLTPDMTDETADELIAFAMRMKEMARVARLMKRTSRTGRRRRRRWTRTTTSPGTPRSASSTSFRSWTARTRYRKGTRPCRSNGSRIIG